MYEEVALEPEREFHFETGRPLAERLGYPTADLDRIPAAAIESFAGVGYFHDLAAIAPGEAVLDLGSGSGMDSFLAALSDRPRRARHRRRHDRRPARQGAPLGRARAASRRSSSAHGLHRAARPSTTARFDCVISNGVINLSPDKPAVFAAAARALRPGGRLALADIVSAQQLPEGVTCDASLWAACIGGAMQQRRLPRRDRGAPASRSRPGARTAPTASSPSGQTTRPRSTASRASRCWRGAADGKHQRHYGMFCPAPRISVHFDCGNRPQVRA